jgi:hypothetical protein
MSGGIDERGEQIEGARAKWDCRAVFEQPTAVESELEASKAKVIR